MSGAVLRSRVPATILDGDCGQGPPREQEGLLQSAQSATLHSPAFEIWEGLFLPRLHSKLNFLLRHSHPGASGISPDASHSLVSLTMGSPGRAPQPSAAAMGAPYGSLW